MYSVFLLVYLFEYANAVEPFVFRKFKCRNNRTIALEFFCDGTDDCDDGSDEKMQRTNFDPFESWQSCVNFHNPTNYSCLVERLLICHDHVICTNLSPCDLKCDSHYKCQKSDDCVLRSTIGNGNSCDGCPEDLGWSNGHGFKCRRNGVPSVLPQQLLHDDISDCDGGVDVCFSDVDKMSRNEMQQISKLQRDKCFQCLDNSMIISSSSVCDGTIDCPDLSDECPCARKKKKPSICRSVVEFTTKIDNSTAKRKNKKSKRSACPVGHVVCRDGECIPRSSVCNGVRDCANDEKFNYCRGTINCRDAMKHEMRCRCRISKILCENVYGVACDGRADCPSGHGDFLRNIRPEDECEAFCYKKSFLHKLNKTFATSYNDSQKCDGFQHCALADDEKNCPNRFECDVIHAEQMSIDIQKKCDGIIHCQNGEDEAEELCNDTRFHCLALGGKKVSIDREFVCDYHITCDDASDEKNCSDGRFYCENGDPLFVKKRQIFNGRGDCTDWSDECPTITDEERDAFSSRYELIANPFIRALVWIMGLLSLCGNATVLHLESKKLRESHNMSPIASANRLLILNLAASDVIMGIYLISLGVAGLTMQGRYCSQELIWRSSSSCQTLGVLSVLSSETSVMTMIMLTSCRLYAVMKPFKSSSRPRKRTILLMIISTWSISLILALIPISPGLQSTFVSHVQFEDDSFFVTVRTKIAGARKLFGRLLTYDLRSDVTVPENIDIGELSWDELRSMSQKLFKHEHFEIKRIFGYYSINSVCIPKFFTKRFDGSWKFSFFVSLFNFCSFVYVATAYALIYFQSRKRAKLRSSSRNNDKGVTDLQAKILRLIITDFICWVPICIMSFASVAGADVPEGAYVFAAIFLLPINSAINPLLYSDLPDVIYQTVLLKLGRAPSSNDCEASKQKSSNNERGTSDSTLVMGERHSHKNRTNNCNKTKGKCNAAYQK